MYIKFDDGIYDDEIRFLADLVALLDSRLAVVDQAIKSSTDPDSLGHCDDGEYYVGMGFVACQRYLAATYGPHGISKRVAMETGPRHTGGETIARIINAAANFWKHFDEWDPRSAAFRDPTNLTARELETIRVIETVTPWEDYTCSNLLAALVSPNAPQLNNLLPQLEAWRDALATPHVG